MEEDKASGDPKGFFSRKSNVNILVVILVVILLALFAGTYLYITDAFRPAPEVTVRADNCYEETLRVVTDEDYAPFSYIDQNGEYAGLDVELMNEIANRLHMNLELELLDWTTANQQFMDGQADIIMNMETDLVADDSRMIATIPTSEKQYVVYGREKASSVADLYGRKVASLHEMPELGLDSDITYINSYSAIFEGLKAGEYEFAICPIQVGNSFLEKLDIQGVQPSYAVSHVYGALALTAGNKALRDRINPVLKELQQEGWMMIWIANGSTTAMKI